MGLKLNYVTYIFLWPCFFSLFERLLFGLDFDSVLRFDFDFSILALLFLLLGDVIFIEGLSNRPCIVGAFCTKPSGFESNCSISK